MQRIKQGSRRKNILSRKKLERLSAQTIRDALIQANDQVLLILEGCSSLRRKATVAIDYTRQPFFGDPDAKNVIGGKNTREEQTGGYTYASIDIVEAGRRLTIHSTIINQFEREASGSLRKLICEARARGIHISVDIA